MPGHCKEQSHWHVSKITGLCPGRPVEQRVLASIEWDTIGNMASHMMLRALSPEATHAEQRLSVA